MPQPVAPPPPPVEKETPEMFLDSSDSLSPLGVLDKNSGEFIIDFARKRCFRSLRGTGLSPAQKLDVPECMLDRAHS